MELYLLRHGRTEANEKRVYCGATDLHLSPGGEAELRALAASRPLPAFDIVADTGMYRTKETADILCSGERVTLPGLQEMNFGLFERKAYETLRFDPYYLQWITDESGDCSCPWGESRNSFYARVRDTFATFLSKLDGSRVCIVCHGGTICAIMDAFCTEKRGFYDWQPAFGHGWRCRLDEKKRPPLLEVLEIL